MPTFLDPSRPDAYCRNKPQRHLTELNPQGKLRQGLLMAVLFEPGNWQRDYVNPAMTFTINGTPTFADSSLGGGTISPGTNGFLGIAPNTDLSSSNWTLSIAMLFTGGFATSTFYSLCDSIDIPFFLVQGADGSTPGALTLTNSNNVGSWNASNYSNWHRLTVVASASGTTGTFYFDGVSQGSNTITVPASGNYGILGHGSRTSTTNNKIADMFLWNYALSAGQVAEHAAAPYGTLLRPRYPTLAQRGITTTGKHPSLMMTGAGP